MIHWICVPAIMFSLFGLIMSIPYPFNTPYRLISNWAFVVLCFALLYYFRLSKTMFAGFTVIGLAMIYGNVWLSEWVHTSRNLALISLLIFTVAWVGQFIGHKIEGKKPSFLQDIQFLLIGPAWLLHFIFNRLGIRY